jgi:hypothetical protein
MSEQQKPEGIEKIVTPTDVEDYFTAYANGASVAHTFFDFQLHFSEIRIRDAEHVKAETFATILMSPQHVKLFLRHLTQNLEMYETKFGEIKIPDNLLQEKTVDIDLRHLKL